MIASRHLSFQFLLSSFYKTSKLVFLKHTLTLHPSPPPLSTLLPERHILPKVLQQFRRVANDGKEVNLALGLGLGLLKVHEDGQLRRRVELGREGGRRGGEEVSLKY